MLENGLTKFVWSFQRILFAHTLQRTVVGFMDIYILAKRL